MRCRLKWEKGIKVVSNPAKGFQAIVVTIAKITLDHDEVRFDGNCNANCCSRQGGTSFG